MSYENYVFTKDVAGHNKGDTVRIVAQSKINKLKSFGAIEPYKEKVVETEVAVEVPEVKQDDTAAEIAAEEITDKQPEPQPSHEPKKDEVKTGTKAMAAPPVNKMQTISVRKNKKRRR